MNELSKELGNFFELIIQVQLLKSVGMSVNQQGMHLNLINWLQKKYLVFGNCTKQLLCNAFNQLKKIIIARTTTSLNSVYIFKTPELLHFFLLTEGVIKFITKRN